jgi:hypothetical protein
MGLYSSNAPKVLTWIAYASRTICAMHFLHAVAVESSERSISTHKFQQGLFEPMDGHAWVELRIENSSS